MLAVAVVLAAGCNGAGEGDYDDLATAYDHGVMARRAMAKAGYGGSEITAVRCGQHFDATETDMGNGNFRTLAREYFIRGCRTPPQHVTTKR
jgi:hypothetical protein